MFPNKAEEKSLRVLAQNQPGLVESTSLFPLYNPSLIPFDLLTCPNQPSPMFHNNHNNVPFSGHKENQGCSTKEEGSNLVMGFSRGERVVNDCSCSSSSSSVSHHAYLDPLQFKLLTITLFFTSLKAFKTL